MASRRQLARIGPTGSEPCIPEAGATEPNIIDFADADIAALVPKSIHIDLNDGELTFTFELG